jgi:hypothetical protein
MIFADTAVSFLQPERGLFFRATAEEDRRSQITPITRITQIRREERRTERQGNSADIVPTRSDVSCSGFLPSLL